MAQVLRPVQGVFDQADYPDLLVGLNNPDDAAAWQLNPNQALLMTTDFFTPVVDDPYDYGAIAAANSVSDIYAMGGVPFLALNIAAMPPDLPSEYLVEIFRGGAETARQAGVVIAGGHTIQDKEPKYGLVVVGFVDPARMMTKRNAKPGDVLVLTKPLGFGTTTTAIKQDVADARDVAEVVEWMKTLNQKASQLAVNAGVRAATDITGFSLLGHAWEMASASGVGMVFEWDKLPFTSAAMHYASQYIFPGGAYDNRLYFEQNVRFERQLVDEYKLLLYDPQTSGGLLLCVKPDRLDELIAESSQQGQPIWQIGSVVEAGGLLIV